MELEKPISFSSSHSSIASSFTTAGDEKECTVIIKDYHAFLAATVRYLNDIREREMRWQWGSESSVVEGLVWLQSLWASRKAVGFLFFFSLSFSVLDGMGWDGMIYCDEMQ
jgi:hypothetical protein